MPARSGGTNGALRRVPQELLILLGAVLLTRLALLAVLGVGLSGEEFTEDVKLHMGFVREPFDLITGESRYTQFPPLIGFAEGIFAYPLQLFMSDFYAIRLTYIAFEVLTAIPFWIAARRLIPDERWRRWALAGYVVLPMGWITSVVMAQEEGLMTLFLLSALCLALDGRDRAAILVCAAGVGVAKIFLVFPLAALVLLLKRGSFISRAALAAAPVLLVYGGAAIVAKANGNDPPLSGFTPPNSFGVNVWTFLTEYADVGYATAKSLSTPLALAAGLLPLAIVLYRRIDWPSMRLPLLWSAMLLWVLTLFYHVNPEYYAYVIPLFLLFFRTRIEIALLVILATVPWGVNLVFADAAKGGGREKLLNIYETVSPVSDEVAYQVFIWITIVATTATALKLTWDVWRQPTEDRP
jgi:hypothetical protein